MRLFNSERIATIMDKLGVQDGEVITHSMVTRAIGRAQKRVELHNFDIREHLLKYDDVMNKQREVIYQNRLDALRGADLQDETRTMIQSFVGDQWTQHVEEQVWTQGEAVLGPLLLVLQQVFLRPFRTQGLDEMSWEMARENLVNQALEAYAQREAVLGAEIMRQLERWCYLRAIDDKWKDHLRELDHLRSSVGLAAWGQKDPLLQFKSEAFAMLEEMLKEIDKQTLTLLFHAQVAVRPPEMERARTEALTYSGAASAAPQSGPRAPTTVVRPASAGPRPALPPLPGSPSPQGAGGPGHAAGMRAMRPGQNAEPARPATVRHTGPKVGRNDPCTCGSGKKYKFCHGASES